MNAARGEIIVERWRRQKMRPQRQLRMPLNDAAGERDWSRKREEQGREKKREGGQL